MNPVALPLFLLGYGLALPVLARWTRVPPKYRAYALTGHQLGVMVAATAWALRGRTFVALAHGLWLVAARLTLGRSVR